MGELQYSSIKSEIGRLSLVGGGYFVSNFGVREDGFGTTTLPVFTIWQKLLGNLIYYLYQIVRCFIKFEFLFRRSQMARSPSIARSQRLFGYKT